jgi:peptidoglycan-N-acetylglucosamine deacetylase
MITTLRVLIASVLTAAAILTGGTAHAENCPIALTFDDGPSDLTDGILNALTAHGAQATFFMVGNMVKSHEDQARRVVGAGMLVGSHSMAHDYLTRMSPSAAAADVQAAASVIDAVTHVRPGIWRPPFMDYNSDIVTAVGMPMVLWSLDSKDWETHSSAATYDRVTSLVHCGDTVLMHDIQPATANSINAILDNLVSRGFRMVTVGNL